MSKPISSFPKEKQEQVIASRLNSKSGGLGFLSAQDSAEAIYRAKMQAAREKIVKKEAAG